MSEPFDREALLREVEDDHEFLAETVELFIEDSESLLQQLGEGLTSGDAPKVASAAHTIKSMVGNFAAAPAQHMALQLEMVGKSGDLTDAPGKLQQLQLEMERLQQALTKLIEGLE